MHRPLLKPTLPTSDIFLLVLLILLVALNFAACAGKEPAASGAEPVSQPEPEGPTRPSESRVGAAAQPSRSGVSERSSQAPIQLSELRFYTENQIRYARGTATNVSGKELRYVEVELGLVDKGGIMVGSVMANTARESGTLKPGAEWRFRVIVLDTRASTLKVKRVSVL